MYVCRWVAMYTCLDQSFEWRMSIVHRKCDLCDVTHLENIWFVWRVSSSFHVIQFSCDLLTTHPDIYVPWLIQRYVCDFPDRHERNDGTPTPCSDNVICVWRDSSRDESWLWRDSSRDRYTVTYSEMFVWLSHRHGKNGGTRTPCFEDAISKNKLTCAQDCKLNPSTSVFYACCRLV